MAQKKEHRDMTTCMERFDNGVVAIGSVITVTDDQGRADIWQIVSDGEGDPSQGRITESAPLSMAVLGHRIGERVIVSGPDGRRWSVTIEAATA
jgi:transcription elongation GreA/GreB family factor